MGWNGPSDQDACGYHAVGADDAAFQHGHIGSQPYVVPNGNRCIWVCDFSPGVLHGVVVAVIDDNAATNHHISAQVNLFGGNQGTAAVHGKELAVQNAVMQDLNGGTIGDFTAPFAAPKGVLSDPDPCFYPGSLQLVAAELHIAAAQADPCAGRQVQNTAPVGQNTALVRPDHLPAEMIQIEIGKKAQLPVKFNLLKYFMYHSLLHTDPAGSATGRHSVYLRR